MGTYTFTRYFTEDCDEMVDLRKAAASVRAHAERRMPHIQAEAAEALKARLRVLDAAVKLLLEPVPPSYGG